MDAQAFVDQYTPRDIAFWAQIAEFVRAAVKKQLSTKERWDPEDLRFVCRAAALLTSFHFGRTGQLSERAVFCNDTVVQFGETSEKALEKELAALPAEERSARRTRGRGTIAKYESTLKAIGRSVNPHGGWPKQSVHRPRLVTVPYTAQEVAQLEADVAANEGLEARQGEAFLVLGLGAGLDGREESALGPQHCHDLGPAGIYIEIAGRRIPVLAAYEERLRALIENTPEGALLIGGDARGRNAVNHARARVKTSQDAVSLDLGRLRNTWLLTHLAMATPVRELMKAAGLKCLTPISDMARFLPDLADEDAQAALRGAGGAR
jgi:hypothetical protein